MTERRETGRPKRPARPRKPGAKPDRRGGGPREQGPKGKRQNKAPVGKPRGSRGKPAPESADWAEGERIAKYLARAGVGSRRDCEALIEAGKVSVNGERLHSPAMKVTGGELIRVGRKIIRPPEQTRLWRYHKPAGLITTTSDPAGRSTIFSQLPKTLPRVVTIGRLDLNTEGLLLLTNDGELARALELPRHAFERRYRARAYGRVDEGKLAELKSGIVVDGERFGSIDAVLDQETGANNWLSVSLTEGKKREVRRALDAVGLTVNRLIRIQYGPFVLDSLKPGVVEEIPTDLLASTLASILPDFTLSGSRPARPEEDGGKRPQRPPTSRFRKRK